MSDAGRRDKLDAAIRNNRRRLALPKLLRLLETEFGWPRHEVELLGLDDSDDANRRFDDELRAKRASGALHASLSLEHEDFQRRAGDWLMSIGDVSLWIVLAHWMHAGALVVRASRLAACPAELVRLDGDTAWGGTLDLRVGFLFDYALETNTYDIACWGQGE